MLPLLAILLTIHSQVSHQILDFSHRKENFKIMMGILCKVRLNLCSFSYFLLVHISSSHLLLWCSAMAKFPLENTLKCSRYFQYRPFFPAKILYEHLLMHILLSLSVIFLPYKEYGFLEIKRVILNEFEEMYFLERPKSIK